MSKGINFKNKYFFPFLLFFIYSLISVVNSAEFLYSVKGYFQMVLSMSMFLLGYTYFNSIKKLDKLNKVTHLVIVLSLIFTLAGYIFGIGRFLNYSEDEEVIGLLGTGGMYSAALAIGILPFTIRSQKKDLFRNGIIVLSIITYIFILLNVRRVAILIPIIGLLVYSLLYRKRFKSLIGIFAGIIILILLKPYYYDILAQRFLLRKETGKFEKGFYKTEPRFLETLTILENTFFFKDPVKSLIGSDLFASGWTDKKQEGRMLHNDFAVLLDGAGIFGVLIYLWLYISLFYYITSKKIPPSDFSSAIKATYLSILTISILLTLNGSLTLITVRSFIFLYLGALLKIYLLKDKQVIRKSIVPKK